MNSKKQASTRREAKDSFLRVVQVLASLSMAAGMGLILSMRQVNPGLAFEFNLLSLAGFFVSGGCTWVAMSRVIEVTQGNGLEEGSRAARRGLWGLSLIGMFGIVVLFLYSLRGVSAGGIRDVLIGVSLASMVLFGVGYSIYRIGKFLDQASEDTDIPDWSEEWDRHARGKDDSNGLS